MKKGYLMVRVSAVGLWCLTTHVEATQRYIERPTNEVLVNRLKAGYRNTEEWLANATSMKWTWDKADFIRDQLPNSDMRELSLWPKYMKNG